MAPTIQSSDEAPINDVSDDVAAVDGDYIQLRDERKIAAHDMEQVMSLLFFLRPRWPAVF